MSVLTAKEAAIADPQHGAAQPDPTRTPHRIASQDRGRRRPPDAVEESKLAERLAVLTLAQKVRLVTGGNIWTTRPEPAIGLRAMVMSDGPAGVRGSTWDERSPSANIPSPTALAASWDEDRVHRMGLLLAGEARRKGVDVLLAPTLNLHRAPFGGRHFENFSEDPLLTARIGTAYVRGLQAGGVGATVKHFVANDSETDRLSVDVVVDERTLREVYLAPFEANVRDAGPWAVMAAYNKVDGVTMTENALLREVLKGEWGFDGVAISDWYAGRSVAAAGQGLLDLVMPGPSGPWGRALVEAVELGHVPEAAVDDKVLRLLRLAARVGALDGMPAALPGPATWSDSEVAAELRSSASAGMVLVRNRNDLLPLDREAIRRVAVLGPNAAIARTLGGGSATVFPAYTVSPLDGLRDALGETAELVHTEGVRTTERLPIAPANLFRTMDRSGPGLEVQFYGDDGRILGSEERQHASWLWWGDVSPTVAVDDVTQVRVRTRLLSPQAGAYALGVSGLGSFELTAGERRLLQTTISVPPGDIVESLMRPPQASVDIALNEGQELPLEVSFRPAATHVPGGDDVAMLSMQLNLLRRVNAEEEMERAVTMAANSDVAIVVVGTTQEVESEGYDRDTLALPGGQDELVRRVAAVNPRTVVVVNAGAPVLLPWADDVAAIVLAWFPGQEFGHALADVLFGVSEPGGRLPTTWPLTDEDHPSVTPIDGTLSYGEGLFVGYRAYQRNGRAPRYPFGHGMGYTHWTYQSIRAPQSVAHGDEVVVAVSLTNTGQRRGREVAQVYASKPDSTLERPNRWLAGFASVELDAGASADVSVRIAPRAFEHWDVEASCWAIEAGAFRLQAGCSSIDLPVSTELTIE